MFKVLIGLEEFARSESLTEACQLFIREIQRQIGAHGMPQMVLYEMCMIEAEYDGVKAIMNFHAIAQFSRAAAILNERGALMDRPAPYISADVERGVFMAANNRSLEAYLAERAEMLTELQSSPPVVPAEPEIVLATR